MTGNEFVKHPPHKNTGLPFEYNLLRLQMESAGLPYMRRVLPGGTLTVRQIFGNSYRVTWVPLKKEEGYVTYVIRYKDVESQIRYRFLNQGFALMADIAASAVTFTENSEGFSLSDMTGYQVQVTDDIIAFWDNDQGSSALRVWFYSVTLGKFCDYYYEPVNVPAVGLGFWSQNDKFYSVPGDAINEIMRITPTWNDETKVYDFTEDAITVVDLGSNTLRFHDGIPFHMSGTTYNFGGIYVPVSLTPVDIDTGLDLTEYTGGDQGDGTVKAWCSPFCYGILENVGGGIWDYDFHPPWDNDDIISGSRTFSSQSGDNPVWPGVFSPLGRKFFFGRSHTGESFGFGSVPEPLSGNCIDWINTNAIPEKLPFVIYEADAPEYWYGLGNTTPISRTFAEFCEGITLETDTQDVYRVYYVPHLERDPNVAKLVGL